MRFGIILFSLLAGCAFVLRVEAITPVPTGATRVGTVSSPGTREWSGSVTCTVDSDQGNYSRHESQTWTLTDAAPTMNGSAMALYPAKWHYTGHGFTHKSDGTVSTWSIDTEKDVRIAIFVRASDNMLTFHQWDVIAMVPGAVTVTQQLKSNNQASSSFAYAAEQWNFQWIVSDPTKVSVTGTRQIPAPIPPQLAYSATANNGASGKRELSATATWQFTKVGAVTVSPPAVTPQAGVTTVPTQPVTSTVTIEAIYPNSATQGARRIITFKAPGTHWKDNTPKFDFGPGISVSSVDTHYADGASMNVDVGVNAAPGKRTVTVTIPVGAGLEVATRTDGFTVNPPKDPGNFTATQSGDGQVDLKWDNVPEADTYLVLGPGATDGTKVSGLNLTLTGIPPGKHEWRVTSWYDPAGSMTKADTWPVATTNVAPYQATYRILLNGLRVYHQTFHDIISPNGSGDDVYAAVGVQYGSRINDNNAAINVMSSTVVKTLIHGTTQDPTHIRAGTATSGGGLTNGDIFPADPTSTTNPPVDGSFPLLLWEGELTHGKDAVAITPSLWKVTTGNTAVFDYWLQDYANFNLINQRKTGTVRSSIQNADLTQITGQDEFLSTSTSQDIANSDSSGAGFSPHDSTPRKDRPIGIVPADADYAPGFFAYRGTAVVVTNEAIEKALNSPSGGLPPGIVAVHLVDNAGSEFAGNYDLYLRVEHGAVASASPNVSTKQAPSGTPGKSVPTPTNKVVTPTSKTGTSPLAPAIATVNPTSGPQWSDALVVTFDAKNTHFVQGTTKVDLGAGVTPVTIAPYQTFDVASPTKVLINAKIAGDAAPGPRNITITTGNEVVKLANGFTVTARNVGEVFPVSPNSGQQGQQNLTVTIARPTGYWSQYFYAGTQLDFGPGISMASVEVQNGSTVRATLNLAANAAVGPHTVTVKRPGFADEAFAGAFTVTDGQVMSDGGRTPTAEFAPPASLASFSPTTVMRGRDASITLTGVNSHFVQGTTQAFFGPGITVWNVGVSSPTSAQADVTVTSAAFLGLRSVTVTTGKESLWLNGLTVTAPQGLSITPNSTTADHPSVTMTLTGQGTHFVQGTTQVGLGLGPPPTVTVLSPTSARVTFVIPSNTRFGTHTVTATTGAEIAELANGFTFGPTPDTWGKGCSAATSLGLLGPGQSITRPGTLHALGVQDWFTLTFAAGTDLTLSVRDDTLGPGGSDFELMVLGGSCTAAVAASTQGGNDPKTVTLSDLGPHQVLVCVKANSWNITHPSFTLTASTKLAPALITTPDPFYFEDTHLALPERDYSSNTITITGITTGVPISINKGYGYYSINNGTFTDAPGTVHAGDTVRLMLHLSLLDVTRFIELNVGGRTAQWEVSTLPR